MEDGMQLGAPAGALPPAQDVAAALLGAASAFGQRPALTVHLDGMRQEQGFASLAGWVAKGAHLLRDELGLGPGAALGVAAPAGWPLAAVVLAAWWDGIAIVPATDADVVVLHTSLTDLATLATAASSVLWIGDELDGAGRPPTDLADTVRGEAWTEAVTPFADRPPPPSRDGSLPAVRWGARSATQLELLALAAAAGDGTYGLDRHAGLDLLRSDDALEVLAAVALRPLVTGRATVVLDASLDPARRARVLEEERVRVGPAVGA
jgi:uncharacterized protein (TIGR03089 family)